MTERNDNPDDGLETLLRQWGAIQARQEAKTPPLPVSKPGQAQPSPTRQVFAFWRRLSYAAAAGLLLAAMIAYLVESHTRPQSAPSLPAPLAQNTTPPQQDLRYPQEAPANHKPLAKKEQAATAAPQQTGPVTLALVQTEVDQLKIALSAERENLARALKRADEQEQQTRFFRKMLTEKDSELRTLADSAREAGELRKKLDAKDRLLAEKSKELADRPASVASARQATSQPGAPGMTLAMAEGATKSAKSGAMIDLGPEERNKPSRSAPPKADAVESGKKQTPSAHGALAADGGGDLKKKDEQATTSEDRDKLQMAQEEKRVELADNRRRGTSAPAVMSGGGAGPAKPGAFGKGAAAGGPRTLVGAPMAGRAAGAAPAARPAAPPAPATAPPLPVIPPGAPVGMASPAAGPAAASEGLFGMRADKAEGRPVGEFFWAEAQQAVLAAAGAEVRGLRAWQAVGRQLKILPRIQAMKARASEPTRRLLEQVESALGKLDGLDPKDVKGITALRQTLDQQQLLAGIDRELVSNTDPPMRQVLVEARLMLTGL